MNAKWTGSLVGGLLIVVSSVGQLSAQMAEANHDTSQVAASAALSELLATPGLMTSVPIIDQPSGKDRAKVFMDIGIAYYALGDSLRAKKALRYAYALDASLDVTPAEAPTVQADLARSFVADLGVSQMRERFAKTSKLRAAGRSLIVPGWGQMYRGHKKRGWLALGATAVAGAFLAKSIADYNSARDAYERTLVSELDLEGLAMGADIPRPFESRFQSYESKANRANAAAILLGAVWGAAVLDNLVLEPPRFALRWEIGR